jgi:hypothetical protein
MIYLPKSQPAPPCLAKEKIKANGTYNCGDVLARLQEDFKNKCYLCEQKAPTSINIEHLVPHQGNLDLKFDWLNLFYACVHCNNTKLAKYKKILNCTVEEDGVETRIRYWMNPYPKEKVEITALAGDAAVTETANLLDDIYNGTTALKLIESANIRNRILQEISKFQRLLLDFYRDSATAQERESLRAKIAKELSSRSSFTAFKRWIIRNHEELMADFQEYLL